MERRKKLWKEEDGRKAVEEALNGAKIVHLVSKYGIPDKTLRRMIQRHQNGEEKKKPGPQPIIGEEAETDLFEWVVGMQKQGFPVSRDMLIVKANQIYQELFGNLRSSGSIGRGWLERFLSRYPQLTLRMSQVIKRNRNDTTVEDLHDFFNKLIKVVIEEKLDADRIFNMDETGFAQRSRSKKVVAVSGSKNVWSKSIDANFHLTIVAAASARGHVLPPVFIVPGQRLSRDVLDECDVEGAKITTAPKGFVNQFLFMSWLDHFTKSIPLHVVRPILLVCDGCSSHYNPDIAAKAASLRVILLPLPPNVTHLYQPLDVSVFKPFKVVLRKKIQEFMITSGNVSINKKDAVKITSAAWKAGVEQRPSNIVSGFRATGIYPVSLVNMRQRLRLFQEGGTKTDMTSPIWLKVRDQVRTDVLSLPPAPKEKKRKTVDVKKRLLTAVDLNDE
jgi:hypothetical protein